MADDTHIEWARHPVTGKGATWNIVTGCQIVSPGCTNCYAMKLAGNRLRNHESRQGLTIQTKAGPVWNGKTRFNEQWLTQPLQWTKPRGIFVCAHGDLFADGVTDDMLDKIFAVMALCPQHVFYVLTKRPGRMRDYLAKLTACYEASDQSLTERIDNPAVDITNSPCAPGKVEENWPLPNVWLGVSVEDQTRANERIEPMADLARDDWTTFVSYEPALGPVDWKPWLRFLKWFIAGGESGSAARPSHPDWFRIARDLCARAGVPFFFKQWGNWRPAPWKLTRIEGETDADYIARSDAEAATDAISRAGYPYHMDHKAWSIERVLPEPDTHAGIRKGTKATAGRLLDGIEHNAFPFLAPLRGEDSKPDRATGEGMGALGEGRL